MVILNCTLDQAKNIALLADKAIKAAYALKTNLDVLRTTVHSAGPSKYEFTPNAYYILNELKRTGDADDHTSQGEIAAYCDGVVWGVYHTLKSMGTPRS